MHPYYKEVGPKSKSQEHDISTEEKWTASFPNVNFIYNHTTAPSAHTTYICMLISNLSVVFHHYFSCQYFYTI